MDIYIDFDHTLFNTNLLTDAMLSTLSSQIVDKRNDLEFEEIKLELKSKFNRKNIYNIYKLAEFFGEKYNVSKEQLVSSVNETIYNGFKYVFEDVVPFLNHLKEKGHRIFLLSFYELGLEYQMAKVTGSKLSDYFDAIIITGKKKFDLTIDYKNSVFIDDKPEDLEGLASNNPYRLIRIKRKEGKYSTRECNCKIENYEECESLKEIKI